MPHAPGMAIGRVAWVDYAKGLSIILVVMMHSTLGVEAAVGEKGWMHHAAAFAEPFRMPGFFLISGLFLSRVIDRDWTSYLDRKVIHFAYFYVLWVTIQFAFKAPGIAAQAGVGGLVAEYALAYVEPFGTLWFIYLLPIFFVAAKLARNVPPLLLWLCAAALEIAPIHTGSTVVDEFAARFVYFYTGYILAGRIFAFAERVQARPPLWLGLVAGWALANHLFVAQGWSRLPLVALGLGLSGAAALTAVAALIAKGRGLAALRYLGHQSLVVYLAFFLPMAMGRVALLESGLIGDVGAISLIVTAGAAIGALAIFRVANRVGLRFLFERPQRFHIAPPPKLRLQPAE